MRKSDLGKVALLQTCHVPGMDEGWSEGNHVIADKTKKATEN